MACRRLGLTLAVALAATTWPAAQRTPLETPDAKAWLTAVRQHETGTVDGPAEDVAGWSEENLDAAIRQALPTAPPAMLGRALSLHTDIAIAERAALEAQAPDLGSALVLLDGRGTRSIRRSAHWAIGARIARTLAARPGGRTPAAEWFRATVALLQLWGDLDVVGGHLDAGEALFERDPWLALYRGTLHQTFADPRLQAFARDRRADLSRARGQLRLTMPGAGVGGRRLVTDGTDMVDLPRNATTELQAAERAFRRALALDPALHEARIRLAHVLCELGDDRQAVTILGPALEAPLAPFPAFYAAMVLGRAEEHRGRYADAGVAYDSAAARFPGAQSAEVGRSRVALAQGRAADALEGIVAVAGPGSKERPDPWPSYFRLHDPDAGTQMRAWRGGLR
jgi:tetratricopeptide (TPR) repeat protein